MSFDAYYYSFEPTGNKEIDSVLEAVADAGNAFHNTEDWSERHEWNNNGISAADKIQESANNAAKKLDSIKEISISHQEPKDYGWYTECNGCGENLDKNKHYDDCPFILTGVINETN